MPKIGEGWESKDFKASRVQLDSSCTHFLQSNYVELGLETLLRSFALARLPRSKVEVITAGSKCPGLRDPVGCHRKMSQDVARCRKTVFRRASQEIIGNH